MVLNPAGFVPIFDFGSPKTVSGYARETISGGEFVFASGATGVVSSGANSFATSDLLFATNASGAQFNGVATQNAGSNSLVTVQVDGVVCSTAAGTINAGTPLACDGVNSVVAAGSVAGNLAALRVVGRALTAAASGGYCLWHING